MRGRWITTTKTAAASYLSRAAASVLLQDGSGAHDRAVAVDVCPAGHGFAVSPAARSRPGHRWMRTGDRLRYGPQVVSRRRPRRWLVTDKRGPMSPRSPRSPRRGLRPRVRVEAPTRAQAHEETGWQSLSSQAELDGVVPRVAGADRPAGSGRERAHLPEPGAHLLSRGHISLLSS